MATIRLDAEPFNFAKPDNLPTWRWRFEHYRMASGLDKESEERQMSTLLYCLGGSADDVLTSTNISAEDCKKYDSVLTKFDEYFKVRNFIFERVKVQSSQPASRGISRGVPDGSLPVGRNVQIRRAQGGNAPTPNCSRHEGRIPLRVIADGR